MERRLPSPLLTLCCGTARMERRLPNPLLALCALTLLALTDLALCSLVNITPQDPLVEVGQSIRLTCRAECPESRPSWTSLDNSTFTQTPDGQRTFLHIESASLDHLGPYRCHAMCAGRDRKQVVHLKVVSFPQPVLSVSPERPLQPGEPFTVTCSMAKVFSGEDAVTMRLFQDGGRIVGLAQHEDEDEEFSDLWMRATDRTATGASQFRCEARIRVNYQDLTKNTTLLIEFEGSSGLRATLQDLQTTAPDLQTTTTVLKTTAPDLKTTTPDTKTTAPDLKTTTTVLKTTAPDLKTTTPDTKTTAPDLKTTTTVLKTTAPDLRTTTPALKTTCNMAVNFVRLLCRCESIVLHKRGETEWRLEKYVGALEDMLVGLKRSSSKPAAEVLKDYSRKVDFLKRLFDAEKLPSTTEKAVANRLLAPGRRPSTANEKTRTVNMQTKSRLAGEVEIELMGAESSKTGPAETVVRHRSRPLRLEDRRSVEELDSVLQKHRLLQEQLEEDVLQLARNLKNNSLADQALPQADGSVEGQRAESQRMSSVSWFLWLAFVLGCFVFISTVLFIRLFPKLR
ncbi:hypothetical protein AAFF_G00266470 [Aldrovandia affinis]|uniref:Vesicle transport protein USE1 n=1 Tax=Aldrovandia affinis TaxID=143900 RepID=A0AAD7W1T2_9TELE|nr:hypothetical protein AAFF_G00266470 [Aldrovandia affinis]